MKNGFYLKLSVLLLLAWTLSLQPLHSNAEDFYGAKWISIPTEKQQPNQWLCFRKIICVDKNTGHTYMDVAVDSKYWLWINEKLVVFEGGLKRGPNPNDTYYDTIDISDYIKKGGNIISILVWYWGKDGYCHKSSGASGLIAQIRHESQSIYTDASWMVCVHPSFGETSDPKPNYRLPECNVHYDARASLGKWKSMSYDDSSWEKATVLGEYPCAPWNKLHQRPFPNWKDSGIVPYKKVSSKKKEDCQQIIGSLPKNITVTPYIKLKAKSGLIVDIRSDNYKGGSEYNVRAEYVTKEGIQEFEMPNYINGHHIIYTLPEGVECLKVGYRETRFNTEFTGKFTCNDDFYNKLWEKSLNTMNLNMRDAIQDPDRERSQWWGDAAIIMNEILYSCDKHGISAIRKAMLNLVDWQKADGTLYSPVPAGMWDKELPLQMLASIGKYGFWNYYLYTGDVETIRYIYPRIKAYLSLWNIDEKGLVKHRSGGWDWADWGDNIDVAILDNAWYCLALESAINMGKLLGDTIFVEYCQSRLALVKASSVETFWNGDFFKSSQYAGITDDRANGMALLAGFADKNKEEKVMNFLMKRYGASPYMEKYILESLFSKGYTKEGLRRMKQRYAEMVESPLTTLWEDWTIGGAGGGSINHGWAGGSLSLLPQYVAGIYPLAAGWDTIMVKPQLGELKWVECTVPIGDSKIEVKVSQDNNRKEYRLDICNKSNKTCVIGLLKNKITKEIKINNSILKMDGLAHENTCVETYGSDKDFLYFRLKMNKSTIICK